MLFTYWHSTDLAVIAESIAHWRTTFPDYEVVGDREVEAELLRGFGDYVSVYRRLRLPAARSDVARLAMLRAHGGFYADCHFAVTRAQDARRFVEAPAAPVVLLTRAALATEGGFMAPEMAERLPPSALPEGWERTSRNAMCPCGSGKKFKHCHGALV